MTVSEALQIVRHAGEDDLPWVDTGTGVDLKVLRIDRTHGTWVIRNRFQPGVQLQTHKHTGTVDFLKTFVLLSAAAATALGVVAIAGASSQGNATLTLLARASLVQARGHDLYSMNTLLRAYAVEQADRHQEEADRGARARDAQAR